MKHLLMMIAAALFAGCDDAQRTSPGSEPVSQTAPNNSIQGATKRGDIEAVKQHLADDADVNAKAGYKGWTALHYATDEGHGEIAELLIAKGADVNAMADIGATPLHPAALSGHKEIAELLIAKGADVNAMGEFDGRTSLHYAAEEGHKKTAELLIAKGADVNAITFGQQTPMHAAAYNGHRNIIELLIEHGADVNPQIKLAGSFNNMTPLDFDLAYNQGQNSELLIEHGGITGSKPDISIHEAAENGYHEPLKYHLIAGTDINSKDENGMTPLHLAVQHGQKEITELLIAKGADLNAKTKPKDHDSISESQKLFMPVEIPKTALDLTALDYFDSPEEKAVKNEIAALLRKHGGKHGSIHSAAKYGDIQGVREFLSVGADVNAMDTFGSTPLHEAALLGHKELGEFLIAEGADVNAKGFGDSTLLHYAARLGAIEIAEWLIANGANVNASAGIGAGLYGSTVGESQEDTPLFVAEYHSQKEMAALLRKHGGKTGHELKAEESLHIAAQYGDLELVRKHLAAGADVNEVDVMGMTPLHLASAGGNHEVVSLLIENGADVGAKITPGRPAEMTLTQKLGQGRLTGMTALHMAATKEIAETLIAKGAKLNERVTFGPHKGNTPLDGFAGSNDPKHTEIADLLRKHGGKTGAELEAVSK